MSSAILPRLHDGPTALTLRSPGARQRAADRSIRYWLVAAPTLVRIPVAGVLTWALIMEAALSSLVLIVAYVALDIVDGKVARVFGYDDALRRTLDVVIDRVSIHVFLLTCCLVFDSGWALFVALVVRDLAHGAFSLHLLRGRDVVVVGAKWHSIYGLFIAVYVSLVVTASPASAAIGWVVLLASVIVLVDYCRSATAAAGYYSKHLAAEV
ncbi:CDP-alcohol phosphatidyltransferase family protein [Nocardioides sp. CN2-186]|uniref:CDP-alcohol phosphatidyltransferase family protein n=1 Tax=Nocardioides tweenelious TaxID=3156607 RepID=UPI0032B5C02B